MKFLIRSIAFVIGGYGLYKLLSTWRAVVFFFTDFFRGPVSPDIEAWLAIPLTLLTILLLFARVVSSYGLFHFREWGRKSAIVVLGLDFLLRLYGAINMLTYSLRHPEPPPIPQDAVIVATVSMWPSYITGIISLIFIIIVTRRSVREEFNGKPVKLIDATNA